MIRVPLYFAMLMAITAAIPPAQAQNPSPAPASSQEDLRAMRQLIEQQSLKIESLSQQVSKLNQQLDAARNPSPSPAPSASVSPHAARAETTVKPEVKLELQPSVEAPRAEAVASPAGLTHVVAKGENLSKIAKQYKTSVADLLKANKIEDDRKLQIGQVLIIPPQKETEPATTKKEID